MTTYPGHGDFDSDRVGPGDIVVGVGAGVAHCLAPDAAGMNEMEYVYLAFQTIENSTGVRQEMTTTLVFEKEWLLQMCHYLIDNISTVQ